MKKWYKIALVFCMSLTLFACGGKGDEKNGDIVIVDQAGREVTLEKPAEKIASGYYIATSTMIGLGLEKNLVGVEMKAETRQIYKEAAPEILELPQLGNKKMFNVEECAKAEPDVVFLPISLESYVSELEELGMQVILLEPESKEGFDEAVEIIAKACGVEERAEEYFEYRDELLDEYIEVEEPNKDATVYFAGMDILAAAGPEMFQGEMIRDAKGSNVFNEKGQKSWAMIDAETLLSCNPAYVFVEFGGVDIAALQNDPVYSALDAVVNKQVYVFPSALETWDTPNLSNCLGTLWMHAVLYPEEVSMEEVEKEAKAFYKEFYDIDVTRGQLGF